MAHDIFISHSSKDKTIADAACACLEARGIRCWIAPRDIVAGADWSESIIDGISGAKAMVLILSSHSNVSKQVLREIERAANRAIPVLPFRVEDIALSKSLEYFLSSSHWLDAYKGPLKHNLEKLANNAAVVIEKQDAVRPLDDPAPSSRWLKPARLAGVLAILAAMLAGVAAWRARDARPAAETRPVSGTGPGATSVAEAQTVVSTGIDGEDLLPTVAKKLGAINGGVGVTRVSERQACGIRSGDVIVKFRDKLVTKCKDIVDAGWTSLSTGEDYPVTVMRDGTPLQLTVRPLEFEPKESQPNDEVRFGEVRRLDPRNGLRKLSRLATLRDTVVAIDVDNKAFAWKVDAPNDSRMEIEGRKFSAVAAGADGPAWLIDATSGELVSWDTASRKVVDVIEGVKDQEVVDLHVTHDGGTAVAIDTTGSVRIWNLQERGVAKRLSLKEAAARHGIWFLGLYAGDFCLTANGQHLGQKTATQFVIWDLEQGEIARVITSEKRITAGTLSPDGRTAAIANESGLVEVWNVSDDKRIATLRWHTDDVQRLLFLSQRYLVSLARTPSDGSALVWDLRDQAVAWGYTDVETNGVFSFGPQLASFNREIGSLFLGVMNVREMSLPGAIADELRSFSWDEDTLKAIAKPSQKAVAGSSTTFSFDDGKTKELVDLAEGSTMATERDASGQVLGMEFLPGPDVVGLGVRIGLGNEGSANGDATTKVRNGVTVEEVVPGGPAARDGVMRKGDVITAVIERDGVEPTQLAGLFAAEVTRLLRGREGTSVRLLVRRDGASEPIEVVAKRGRLLPVRNKAAHNAFANSIGMEFVAVPSGIGTLGIKRFGDETRTPHYVRISKGFLIGAHEVTQEEFAAVMTARPSVFAQNGQKAGDVERALATGAIPNPDTSHHPVESVSWEDATDFCKRLSEKEGRLYRLPTEAEWEWACRNAGMTTWNDTAYPAGKGANETAVARHLDFPQTPHPVGGRSPNDAGIYDMFGNVAEWCADVFTEDGFTKASCVDPKGPPSGLKRVVRGGAFQDGDNAYFERTGLGPSEKRPYVGFRILLEPMVGMLADNGLEQSILNTSRWEIDESSIPDPIPAIVGQRRSRQEEQEELTKIKETIENNGDLREVRAQLIASGPSNQSEFINMRGPWAEINSRLDDRKPQQAMDAYNMAHNPATRSNICSVSLLEQARQNDPLLGWASNDMAWALATNPDEELRDPAVAVMRAVEACHTAKWQYWGFLDTLAASLAAAGRYESAVRVAEVALSRAPASEQKELSRNLERYKQGKAYAPVDP